MMQMDIYDRLAARRLRSDRPTIEARFDAFHRANPHVMEELLRLAREDLAAGKRRIGVKALYERCRESLRVNKLGNYKLDNSLTASYARALLNAEPMLVGVIEVRRRRTP